MLNETVAGIIVLSGPSGCGKSTLINMLLKKNPELSFAVSHTTRPRRRGERNGKAYYFVSQAEFVKMKEENQFLEWAPVHSHYYGTSRQEVKRKSEQPGMLILDLDVQGARSMKKLFPRSILILVIPPSIQELKRRLIQRHDAQDQSEIDRRLSVARDELSQYGLYDFVVINEDKERAFSVLNCIYVALSHQISYYKDVIDQITESQK
jgi:guanylate kinase